MKYQGGKTRIAKRLAAEMLSHSENRKRYVEPFVGGGSVATAMVPNFESALLSDSSLDLVLLWRATQDGWIPPTCLSEQEYYELKGSFPSPLRGFAAYACSWGGKKWGGYGRDRQGNRNFADEGSRAILRKIQCLHNADFECLDFESLNIRATDVVYCDPPYFGTTEYAESNFSKDRFVRTIQKWANLGSTVFVSEATILSPTWNTVWEGNAPVSGYERKENRKEFLFKVSVSSSTGRAADS